MFRYIARTRPPHACKQPYQPDEKDGRADCPKWTIVVLFIKIKKNPEFGNLESLDDISTHAKACQSSESQLSIMRTLTLWMKSSSPRWTEWDVAGHETMTMTRTRNRRLARRRKGRQLTRPTVEWRQAAAVLSVCTGQPSIGADRQPGRKEKWQKTHHCVRNGAAETSRRENFSAAS